VPAAAIDFGEHGNIFIPLPVLTQGISMPKFSLAFVCLSALLLASCGNTAWGLKRDGQDASHAMDNATHRVLSAGAKK
jgi:predicted small secreted protein